MSHTKTNDKQILAMIPAGGWEPVAENAATGRAGAFPTVKKGIPS